MSVDDHSLSKCAQAFEIGSFVASLLVVRLTPTRMSAMFRNEIITLESSDPNYRLL